MTGASDQRLEHSGRDSSSSTSSLFDDLWGAVLSGSDPNEPAPPDTDTTNADDVNLSQPAHPTARTDWDDIDVESEDIEALSEDFDQLPSNLDLEELTGDEQESSGVTSDFVVLFSDFDDDDELDFDEEIPATLAGEGKTRPLSMPELTVVLKDDVLPRLDRRFSYKGYATLGHLAYAVNALQNSATHLHFVREHVERRRIPVTRSIYVRKSGIEIPDWAFSRAKELFSDLVRLEDPDDLAWALRKRAARDTTDPFEIYMQQARNIPLLTREQEVEYANAVELRAYLCSEAEYLTPYGGSVTDTILSHPEAIALEIFSSFARRWNVVDHLYRALNPSEPPLTRSSMLQGLLPISNVPESVCRRVAHTLGMDIDELEQSIRQRQIEWELLPAAFRQRLDYPDAFLETYAANFAIAAVSEELADHYRIILESGDAARDAMIQSNLRLVVHWAVKYQDQGVEIADLVQEGNLGLIRAVNGYQHHKGFKFSTYASWWIRQGLSRAIADKSRVIRLPVHAHDRLMRAKRVEAELEHSMGRQPTVEELASTLEMSTDDLRELRQRAQPVESLERLLAESDNYDDLSIFEDDPGTSPLVHAAAASLSDQVERVLSTLSDRERWVIEMRFGIDGGGPRTLEDVGQQIGVTRERIRQIQQKAIKRLCHPSRSRLLRDSYGSGLTDTHETTYSSWTVKMYPVTKQASSVLGDIEDQESDSIDTGKTTPPTSSPSAKTSERSSWSHG